VELRTTCIKKYQIQRLSK